MTMMTLQILYDLNIKNLNLYFLLISFCASHGVTTSKNLGREKYLEAKSNLVAWYRNKISCTFMKKWENSANFEFSTTDYGIIWYIMTYNDRLWCIRFSIWFIMIYYNIWIYMLAAMSTIRPIIQGLGSLHWAFHSRLGSQRDLVV